MQRFLFRTYFFVASAFWLWFYRARQAVLHPPQAPAPASAAHYQNIFEHCPDAIFVVAVLPAAKFRIEHLNPVAAKLLAPQGEALAGCSLDEIAARHVGEDGRRMLQGLAARLQRTVNSGQPAQYEGAFGFGQKIYDIRLLPVAYAAGNTHVLGFARDITPQKLYERELQNRTRLEERLSGFTASAPGFFYSYRHGLDGSNTMPFASEGIHELFGLRPGDVAASIAPLNLLTHLEDMSPVIEAIAQSAAKLTPLNLEFRTRHPEKGLLWIEARAVPVSQADGSITWHGFMHDISGRKHTEQQLLDTQNKLRELVISREQLREDERRHVAWEMHEELGQLLVAIKLRVGGSGQHSASDENSLAISGLIDESIATLHEIVSAVRPTVLLHGAAAALEWLVAEFNRHNDMRCELVCDEQAGGEADDELSTLVFRIAQEALENAARHSGVSRVSVSWISKPDGHYLSVQHDGATQTDAGSENAKSLSFFGMEERVKARGGAMRLTVTSENGTLIEVRFGKE